MKLNKLIYIALAIIVSISFFTRFYNIENIPPHLSSDEISIAYDAYSLSQNQKDEHNNFLPLSFQSHGDYKSPLYGYLLSPFYHFLPNINFTARLPSIFLGLLTTIIIGLITFQLTSNKSISIISSIILLSSPWHIITSRMVLESNIALLFLSLGIIFFLISVKFKKTLFLYLSVLNFSLSMYGYHTEWGLVPILFLLMLFLFYKKDKTKIIFSLIIFLVLTSPTIIDFFNTLHTNARANTEAIWKETSVVNSINHNPIFLSPLIIAKAVFEKYLNYINPSYLFFSGSQLLGSKNIFEPGLFLWPLFFPFFYGLFNIKKYFKKKYLTFFLIFLTISPIVSSFTEGPASFVRNLNSVLPYTILISIGLFEIFFKFRKISLILIFLLAVSAFYFSSIYLFHYSIEKAEGFQGYRPIATFLTRDSKNYQHIYVDSKFGKNCQFVGVPHLYLAYYQSFDPQILQKRFNTKLGDSFDKYTITQIDWNNFEFKEGDLYVVSICNLPVPRVLDKIKLTTKFTDTAGNPAFELWQTK